MILFLIFILQLIFLNNFRLVYYFISSVQSKAPRTGAPCTARTSRSPAPRQEASGEALRPWKLIPVQLPHRVPTAHRYFRPTTRDASTQTGCQGRDQDAQTTSVHISELPPVPIVPPLISPPTTPPRKPRTLGRRKIPPVSSAYIKALQKKPAA